MSFQKTANQHQRRPGAGRRRRDIVVAVVAILVGVAIFAYPMVSNYLEQQSRSHVVATQSDKVDETEQAVLDEEKQKAIDYNNKLLSSRTVITDPFDPDTQRVTDEEYESVLNLNGDGVMGTITIPKIHVEMPIYHGTDDETLQKGVGHLQETSVPIGGESTHSVLSGHTGLPSMKVFDNLDQLEVGDYFIITVLGEDHAYRVTSTEVVLPDETDSLVIQPGKDLCTLVTCTPYGINTHRLLVHAERCEVPDEWLNKGDSTFPAGYSDPPDKALLPSILLGLLLAALIIGGYAGIRKLRARHMAAVAPAGLSGKGVSPAHAPTSRGGVTPPRPYGPRSQTKRSRPAPKLHRKTTASTVRANRSAHTARAANQSHKLTRPTSGDGGRHFRDQNAPRS